jgi:hypothetical protein
VLALAGIAIATVATARGDTPVRRRAMLALVVAAAVVPVLFAVATRPAMYNGVRHFLFVVPPLAVLGGLAASRALQWLAREFRSAAAVAGAILVLGLLVPAREIMRLHPYEYTHFNELIGGVEGAQRRFMLDYWGLALKQAGGALREKIGRDGDKPPPDRRWRVAVCGPHPPARIALGPAFDVTWSPHNADFIMAIGVFYCLRHDAPVIARIERENVAYATVYDIRGRNILSVLTLPLGWDME